MKTIITIFIFGVFFINNVFSQPWMPDMGNGNYKNPIIYADYSDPDIIRSGNDFYMVASSFNCMPGIPILHSTDLVNWEIINHVYDRLPLEKYNKPVHGEGSWAPAIRYHRGKYYVYFCTPYDGLFMASADHPTGNWELKHLVKVDNWEDPCPFWDDDGKAYLVRSKLCGNALYLHRMSTDGETVLDNGTLIYRDKSQPTIEGPKFLKKDGYYYIFAPAGGVPAGWQTVLRSKNIYGPYEARKVMHTGNTNINGPHQGGIVELPSGEWWFVHFQDRDMYGRIVHLQPVTWTDGWPLIGIDQNNDGIGEPVAEYAKPNVEARSEIKLPQTSDEFDGTELGLQWQWHANPQTAWYSFNPDEGKLRLNAVKNITQNGDFWYVPNLLLQKFPAPSFTVATKVGFNPHLNGERCGLAVMGNSWSYIAIVNENDILYVRTYQGKNDRCDESTTMISSEIYPACECYFRLKATADGMCRFSYSNDNITFKETGKPFKAEKGKWIGAKTGIFCINPNMKESNGYALFDWFRVE
jgi:beta-xylosidase